MSKIIFIIAFLYGIKDIYACTLIYSPPAKFDSSEYIFLGKVVDHVTSTSKNPQLIYHGIEVQLLEEIYLPQKSNNNYEIYPLSLGSDCSTGPIDESDIEDYFPIGSEVRVVAKVTDIIFELADSSNIQLEVSPHNQFHLSLNIKELPFLISDKESQFSYEKTSQDSLRIIFENCIKSIDKSDTRKYKQINSSVLYQRDFELRKDLYWLSILDDDKSKARIIYRIINFHYLGIVKLLNIIQNSIKSDRIENRLISSIFKFNDNVRPLEMIVR